MPKGQYDRTSQRAPPSIPPIIDICQQIPDEVAAIRFLTSRGILTAPNETICRPCGHRGCRVKSKKTPKSLKCNVARCGKSQSLLHGTIFARSRMPLHQLLYLSAFWLFESPPAVVRNQLHCSAGTVFEYYRLFRRMVARVVALDDELIFGGACPGPTTTRAAGSGGGEDAAVSAWRERNANDLWGALLAVLRRLRYILGEFEERADRFPWRDVLFASVAARPGLPWKEEEEEGGNDREVSRRIEQPPHRMIDDGDTAAGAKLEGQQQRKKRRRECSKSKEMSHLQGQRQLSSLFTFGAAKPVKDPEGGNSSSKRPKKLQSIPSFMDICCMIPSEDKAIEFLIKEGVFTEPQDITCSHCGYRGFRAKSKRTPKSIKCNRCSKGASLMKGTFFEGTRAPLHQALYIALFWLSLSPASTVIAQLRCSSATVTDLSDRLRRLAGRHLEAQRQATGSVGPLDEKDAARLKPYIPRFARRGLRDDHVRAAAWREANEGGLWEAFLAALRTVKCDDGVRGVEVGDLPWVDGVNGKACCNYHLKLHLQQQKQQGRLHD